jgi:protein-tyrosine phosphatase
VQCVEAAAEDTGGQRWVVLDGAFNFRDLGGYATRQGARLRWGSLYRSDALQHLSARDVEVLAGLGVNRVIDLRAPDEIAAVGRGVLTDGSFGYLNAPVLPSISGEALGAPPGDDVGGRYLWYLDIGRQALVDAIEALAEPDRGAVVFHCAAGKDRTGVLAALVLALLDVGYDDIVADYALTNRALPSILDRLAADPLHAASVAKMPADRRTVRPEAMRRFLDLLDDKYGGARSWAASAGLAPRCIDALRAGLYVTA